MLRLSDWFCGAGGSTQGLAAVPGVEALHAANHWDRAVESHAANFPDVDHHCGDIRDLDVSRLPYAELFWASPECPQWSQANGKQRTYAINDVELPGLERPRDVEAERSRALMEEVPLYLEAMALRGRPVLAGVVENVTDVRKWIHWDAWVRRIQLAGYRTRLIALNSMHAQSIRTPRAPQSRDRLYLAYWHISLRRDPDWDKWLRPTAWCPSCDQQITAVQAFKDPTRDMGRYRQQYVYRCPNSSCRGQIVEPTFIPAAAAIDWTIPGQRIGDRSRPLAEKTIRRIEAGIRRYARPITLEAAGNTFERRPGVRTWPIDGAMTTLTTTATKAIAVPPLLVPAGGTWNDTCTSLDEPMRTRTTRDTDGVFVPPLVMRNNSSSGDGAEMSTPVSEEMRTITTAGHQSLVVPLRTHGTATDVGKPFKTFVAGNQGMAAVVPPFIAELRGGGSDARAVTEALATVTASGNHHALITMRQWAALYQYDTGLLRALDEVLPTQTTVSGDGLLQGAGLPAVEDCLFRMLEPHEIGAGMAFAADYIVIGNRRERTRQYGNAVTPPVAEVIGSALVEAITGEPVT